ncbi:MAG TPA: cold shock domain-containing protein [Candidatus Acidoferrales bacterium]|nr:cold shock domain-containing protein [Candidatus Acidoferrales bacterium]
MFGTVVHYDRIAAYGFIVPDDSTLPDYFTCAKFLKADKPRRFLIVGQRVEFDPVDTDTSKPQAHNVRVIPVTIARQTSAGAVRS